MVKYKNPNKGNTLSALVKLLIEKDIVTEEELDNKRKSLKVRKDKK